MLAAFSVCHQRSLAFVSAVFPLDVLAVVHLVSSHVLCPLCSPSHMLVVAPFCLST